MKLPIRVLAVTLVTALLLPIPAAAALMHLRPGDLPPPISLPDLAGRTVVAREFGAGAPTVILFWSTWSPRSGEMLDDLKRYHAAYAGRGLKILAVNIDGEHLGPTRKTAVGEYAAARALPFPVLLDERLEVFASWGVMAYPTEVVLDAIGRIIYVLPGYPPSLREELKSAIETALGIVAPPPPPETTTVGYVPQGGALMHYNLGRLMLAKGDVGRALEAFRKSSTADPSFLEPALLTARLATALGNLGAAEQFVRQVSPEQLNRGDLRYLLGNLMLLKGNVDGAEQAFRSLQERLPREAWGLWGLGLTALARNDRAGALVFMEQARAIQPENPEAEAYAKNYFRDRCLRRETAVEDAAFERIFPAIAEMRDRYCRLFGGGGQQKDGSPP